MKDKGLVVSTKNSFAEVEVNCLEACQGCSAKALCLGRSESKGILSVKNPLHASPGDEVVIDIPEEVYSKSLILLFGSLLLSALLGMTAGYFSSGIFPLSPSIASILGLFLGLAAAGTWLFRHFQKKANLRLFPTITGIIHKGGHHG